MFHTYVGTQEGVYRIDQDGIHTLGLTGHRFWAIHATPNGDDADTVLAGSYGQGIFRSEDSGTTWHSANDGLTATAIRVIQPDPTDPAALLCGTEPGRGFRSIDGGQSWRELDSITDIPSCPDWYLPYSPRAGALRNFYSPPGKPEQLYGALEVGGLLVSQDCGDSWELDTLRFGGYDHDDVHEISGHPTDSNLLFVALGGARLNREPLPPGPRKVGGIARSDDGGQSWQKVHTEYTRSVIVPPASPDLVLAGPAEKTGRLGTIVVSDDRGASWQPAHEGIDVPMDDMVEDFYIAPDQSVWAVTSGGRLYHAVVGEWRWEQIAGGLFAESVSFVQ